MTARRAGLAIAVAAILVQAPRLVLALLAADRLPVAPGTERALLVLAGIGTALVLTGGNLYLAHTVAQVQPWRRTLAAAWITVAASGGLALPLIVAGLTARTLPQVLGARQLEWPWALLAAIAHELTAAGCVFASAAWAGTPAAAAAANLAALPQPARSLPAAAAALLAAVGSLPQPVAGSTAAPPDPMPSRLRQKLRLSAGCHRAPAPLRTPPRACRHVAASPVGNGCWHDGRSASPPCRTLAGTAAGTTPLLPHPCGHGRWQSAAPATTLASAVPARHPPAALLAAPCRHSCQQGCRCCRRPAGRAAGTAPLRTHCPHSWQRPQPTRQALLGRHDVSRHERLIY